MTFEEKQRIFELLIRINEARNAIVKYMDSIEETTNLNKSLMFEIKKVMKEIIEPAYNEVLIKIHKEDVK